MNASIRNRCGVMLFIILFALFVVSVPSAFATGRSWMQTSSGSRNWASVAMSADGTKIVATIDISLGGLYVSSDSGNTWQTLGGVDHFTWVAMSADGSTLLAFAPQSLSTGQYFISPWSGDSWPNPTLKTISGATGVLISGAMSSNGQKIVAVSSNGRVYATSNGGTTWGQIKILTSEDYTVTLSSDGSEVIITDDQGGDFYTGLLSGGTYTNSGSWTFVTQNSGIIPMTTALSSDGTKIVSPGALDKVYGGTLSNNVLLGFAGLGDSPTGDWTYSLGNGIYPAGPAVAMSADGTVIAAADDISGTGYLWLSANSGTNWVQQTNAGSTDWSSIAMSADGSLLAAVQGTNNSTPGPIWLSTTTPTVTVQAASDITTTGATLNGTITSNNGATYASAEGFVWGTTLSYGATTSSAGQFSTGAFTGSATGLTCATTYDFAAFATTSAGVSYSPNTTFQTSACAVAPTPTPTPVQTGFLPGGTSSSQQQANLRAIYAYNNQVCPPSLCPSQPSSAAVTPSTNMPTVSAFTRDLQIGSTGSDAQVLQQFLNSKGFAVSITGGGAPGHETTYFGPATQAALARFQKANGISPAGRVFRTGDEGVHRRALNRLTAYTRIATIATVSGDSPYAYQLAITNI